MTHSAQFSQITDELLSAYLDQEVSAAEKQLVEAAVAADPEIAWRLESLRQTVQLLRTLPSVALPRSFVLTEAQLSAAPEPVAARSVQPVPARRALPQRETAPSGWQVLLAGWRNFWQAGSPVLRNAMAASFVLLLVLLVGDEFLLSRPFTPSQPRTARTIAVEVAPTPLPTAVVIAAAQSAAAEPVVPTTQPGVPAQENAANNTVVADSVVAANPVSSNDQGSASTARTTMPTTSEILAASAPPGEDSGVVLDPAAAGAAQPETGFGGEQERALAEAAPPVAQRVAKQADLVESDQVTAAAFISPLEVSVAAPATANRSAITTSLAQTGGAVLTEPTTSTQVALAPAALPASSVALTTTEIATGTVRAGDESAVSEPAQAEPAPNVAAAPADRIRLLQLVSALVTLVLAGLWWRSR